MFKWGMRIKWSRISLVIILCFIVFCWLLFNFGLVHYWLVKWQIAQLTGSERETAESEFYAFGKAGHFFAGTLAKINHHGHGGVWVWTNQGLKYFQADQYTLYSYYDICDARNNKTGSGFKVDYSSREITADFYQWADLVRTGDFVQLSLATVKNGGKEGNLREIYAYSQPLFLPLNLELVCSN